MAIWGRYTFQGPGIRDLHQEYLAAQSFLNGGSIYGEEVRAFSRERTGTSVQNFHPPFLTLITLPFATLPFELVFTSFNLLSLLLFLLVVWHALPTTFPRPMLVAASLLWPPVHACFVFGQWSAVLAALILFAHKKLSKGHDRIAGCALGIAALIKLFPLFYILPLVVLKRWRGVYALTATFVAGSLICAVVFGQEVARYFLEIAPRNIEAWGDFPSNASITGVVFPLLLKNGWVDEFLDSRILAHSAVAILSILVCGITALFTWRQKTFGSTATAMLLISPITWNHNFIILVPALLETLATTRYQAAALLCVIALSVPDVEWFNWLMERLAPGKIPAPLYPVVKLPTLGLFGLWLLSIKRAKSEANEERSQPHIVQQP